MTGSAEGPRLVGAMEDLRTVLVLLVAAYILTTASRLGSVQWVVTGLYVAALAVTFRAAHPSGRRWRILGGWALVAVLAAAVALATLAPSDAEGVIDMLVAVTLMVTLVALLRRVLSDREVTRETLAGALSAYLLLGMTFAALYGVAAWLQGAALFAQTDAVDTRTLQYFSFVTLTTTGYGDLSPATSTARGLATMEALVGQAFLATLVARLVATFRSPAARD
ncbi:ion channel [Xylanimonas sp. McL0601]|uniref:potassium channel family protein n=1 Tax=Xylanimonas sp. McL0601 TaxID=3414739 RepID=UPI003CF0CA35